jgi:hypothetical protein
LLIHDRDAKLSRAFDAIFNGDGIRVIRTPVRAPNANAHIERWVGSARRECLDRILIFNRRQLERVLNIYIRHDNERRPHRALDLQTPDPNACPEQAGFDARRADAHGDSTTRPTRRTHPRIRSHRRMRSSKCTPTGFILGRVVAGSRLARG